MGAGYLLPFEQVGKGGERSTHSVQDDFDSDVFSFNTEAIMDTADDITSAVASLSRQACWVKTYTE